MRATSHATVNHSFPGAPSVSGNAGRKRSHYIGSQPALGFGSPSAPRRFPPVAVRLRDRAPRPLPLHDSRVLVLGSGGEG